MTVQWNGQIWRVESRERQGDVWVLGLVRPDDYGADDAPLVWAPESEVQR